MPPLPAGLGAEAAGWGQLESLSGLLASADPAPEPRAVLFRWGVLGSLTLLLPSTPGAQRRRHGEAVPAPPSSLPAPPPLLPAPRVSREHLYAP